MIDAIFCDLLKEMIKKMLEEQPKKNRKQIVANLKKKAQVQIKPHKQKGIQLFQRAKDLAINQIKGSISCPQELEGIAEIHGSLITFTKPYPVFHRFPKASFKGLIRIDGDKLLNEIVANYQLRKNSKRIVRKIKLPYC
jgi:hypothetical protein